MRVRRGVAALALAGLLAACSGRIVPPGSAGARPADRPTRGQPGTPMAPVAAPPAPAATPNAAQAGLAAGPPFASLAVTRDNADRALAAFRASCPALLRRSDTSGLTQGEDWRAACTAAPGARDAGEFFARFFETVQVADGKAFATGYFEAEIRGSRTRQPGYETPVYARPADLVEIDLGLFSAELKGKRIRGRIDGQGFVPYPDRGAIEQGAIDARARVIAWAADPIDLFFLQIQGSGRLLLPDGGILRIGYDSQNGRDYTGIGALMRQRGLLAPGQASMQGIVQWLRDHPAEGRALMRENRSYVFFRELQVGAIGAMGVPVTGGVSAATDARFVPLGAPVYLSMDRADASGLWIAQDTGGAIKGANRFDTFWGAGDAARATAGGMSAHGTAFVLLPAGTLARLGAGSGGPNARP